MTRATIALSVLLVALGLAAIVRTAAAGGGAVAFGYLFGAALTVAGVLRLYLTLRSVRGS